MKHPYKTGIVAILIFGAVAATTQLAFAWTAPEIMTIECIHNPGNIVYETHYVTGSGTNFEGCSESFVVADDGRKHDDPGSHNCQWTRRTVPGP